MACVYNFKWIKKKKNEKNNHPFRVKTVFLLILSSSKNNWEEMRCQHCLHFPAQDIKKWRIGGWNAWRKRQKNNTFTKKERRKERDQPNEPFEQHRQQQGKSKFPLGAFRVSSGGWVRLAGVMESKVCSESWDSNSSGICSCLWG